MSYEPIVARLLRNPMGNSFMAHLHTRKRRGRGLGLNDSAVSQKPVFLHFLTRLRMEESEDATRIHENTMVSPK